VWTSAQAWLLKLSNSISGIVSVQVPGTFSGFPGTTVTPSQMKLLDYSAIRKCLAPFQLSRCGVVKETLDLSERVYECACCGLVIDRDLNAARNLAQLARASCTEPVGVKAR